MKKEKKASGCEALYDISRSISMLIQIKKLQVQHFPSYPLDALVVDRKCLNKAKVAVKGRLQ